MRFNASMYRFNGSMDRDDEAQLRSFVSRSRSDGPMTLSVPSMYRENEGMYRSIDPGSRS